MRIGAAERRKKYAKVRRLRLAVWVGYRRVTYQNLWANGVRRCANNNASGGTEREGDRSDRRVLQRTAGTPRFPLFVSYFRLLLLSSFLFPLSNGLRQHSLTSTSFPRRRRHLANHPLARRRHLQIQPLSANPTDPVLQARASPTTFPPHPPMSAAPLRLSSSEG